MAKKPTPKPATRATTQTVTKATPKPATRATTKPVTKTTPKVASKNTTQTINSIINEHRKNTKNDNSIMTALKDITSNPNKLDPKDPNHVQAMSLIMDIMKKD